MRLIDNIAPPFSSTATYNRGDKVINDNILYECSVDNYTPGVFSEDNFKKAYLCDMVGAGSNNGSSDIDYIAPLFDSEKEYMKDDAVIYDGLLYICNEDNVTGEFDVSKWTKKSLIEVGELDSNLTKEIIFEEPILYENGNETIPCNIGDYFITKEGVTFTNAIDVINVPNTNWFKVIQATSNSIKCTYGHSYYISRIVLS